MQQSESNEKLPKVSVEESDGMAHVVLRSNYEEVTRDDEGITYTWTERTLDIPYTETLEADIESNFDAWVEYADSLDEKATTERERRAAIESATENLPTIESSVTQLEADAAYIAMMAGIEL